MPQLFWLNNTSHYFKNRKEKARYVFNTYQALLRGKVLDVGADKGHLHSYLKGKKVYQTIGLENYHHLKVNLEQHLPIKTNRADCVLCLDVLEHIENIHQLFDELCRITNKYLIISLPNSWMDFLVALKRGYWDEKRPLKYYNLPYRPPKDRHRWFYNITEAEAFIKFKAKQNKMKILRQDYFGLREPKKTLTQIFFRILAKKIPLINFTVQSLWTVLEKKNE